jgi:hypothetical protein
VEIDIQESESSHSEIFEEEEESSYASEEPSEEEIAPQQNILNLFKVQYELLLLEQLVND